MTTKRILADRVTFRHNPWRTLGDFCRESGAEGGINAGFFSRGSSHPHDSRVVGMVVVDGKRGRGGWWDPSAFWHGVVKLYDEEPRIMESPERWWGAPDIEEVEWAVGMGPIVLADGEVRVLDGDRFPGTTPNSRVQRVAFGLTPDRGEAVFAYRTSATAAEMGQILLEQGCHHGILGDGGSSAQYQDGNTRHGSQLVPNVLMWTPGVGGLRWADIQGQGTNHFQIAKNFQLYEFECSHCNVVKLKPELVRRVQKIRDHFDAPFIITSGYRCPEWDRAVGGSGEGTHTQGQALDGYIQGVSHSELADYAEDMFRNDGLGRYNNHTHLDVRGYRARWEG